MKDTDKINNLKNYIRNITDADVNIRLIPGERLGKLPFAIGRMYTYYEANLFGRKIILIFVNPDETSVDRIFKHTGIIAKALMLPVVAVFENIESYTRKRLIEKRVSFIAQDKQMYLPDLLVDLKEFNLLRKEQPETMPPVAQCLFLFFLQAHPLINHNMKAIAEIIGYNPMQVSRAADYLLSVNLCKIIGNKDKYLSFDNNKRELWNNALPLMTNPVKKFNYYTGNINLDVHLRKTNINALAHYTDLNDEQVAYFAAPLGYIKHLEGPGLTNIGKNEGEIFVEEWKYDPAIIAKDTRFVDPLSLYLCFRDNPNERIQGALELLIKNMKW